MKIRDAARIVRSKNAGPTLLTIDVLFDDAETLQAAILAVTAARVAACYELADAAVEVIPYPPAHALKIVMRRTITAGSPGDRDAYGAQQHGPLMELGL